MFRIKHVISKQNERSWCAECTDEHNTVVMNNPDVFTWEATSKERVIGQYFFENKDFMDESSQNLSVPSTFRRFRLLEEKNISQQGSAPSHYSNQLRTSLNKKSSNN